MFVVTIFILIALWIILTFCLAIKFLLILRDQMELTPEESARIQCELEIFRRNQEDAQS